MTCPHCQQEIPPGELAKHFASLGGSKNTKAQRKARLANIKKSKGRPKKL